VRVIAGVAKGVRLAAPRGATRPTTDLVREAVFSVFAGWAGTGGAGAARQLAGLSLLDLFAGSGAIAIEAASRGAAPVVAVDSWASAVAAMQANVGAVRLPVDVVRANVGTYLKGVPRPFDIVWLDPPYEQDADAVLAGLGPWVAADGLVALERAARSQTPAWPPGLVPAWAKRYGETVVYFARPDKEAP